MSGRSHVEMAGAWVARRRERWMERVTWFTVAAAFIIWLAFATAGSLWARSVLQHAAAPAPSVLESVGGVVLYREADQRKDASAQPGMKVFDGDELVTRVASIAGLRIFDGSLIEMYPDARVQVRATRIGRFNPAATVASLTLSEGAVRLSIPPSGDKAHTVNVATSHGEAAFTPGEYTLRVGADGTRISVWNGRSSVVVAPRSVEVETGQSIVLSASSEFEVSDLLENVVANGDFLQSFQGWEPWESREQGRPDARGAREVVHSTGSDAPPRALRVTRVSQADAHNETGLKQAIGRDVRGARSVRLEARVRIDLASLSGGGYLGSEYPMMIRVRYHDHRGVEGTWTQGFYYSNPDNRPTPVGHVVERGWWSPFAVELAPLLNRPSVIDSIEVFGAGHTFDASVGDVKLLVD